jgi:hypothetical protein
MSIRHDIAEENMPSDWNHGAYNASLTESDNGNIQLSTADGAPNHLQGGHENMSLAHPSASHFEQAETTESYGRLSSSNTLIFEEMDLPCLFRASKEIGNNGSMTESSIRFALSCHGIQAHVRCVQLENVMIPHRPP